jgi:hypothetical protein
MTLFDWITNFLDNSTGKHKNFNKILKYLGKFNSQSTGKKSLAGRKKIEKYVPSDDLKKQVLSSIFYSL